MRDEDHRGTDHLETNLARWDERAPAHAASPDYALAAYRTDPEHLSSIVAFDRERLGDVRGLDAVHLQCHIGTDTVSLARLGARMTGLDFSPAAVQQARHLAESIDLDVSFVEAELYSAVEVLGAERFDLVYTGIGALCWLPNIRGWAEVVAGLLRPGGRLFLRETHPVLWSIDVDRGDALALAFPYWEQTEPIFWDDEGTYVQTDVRFTHNRSYEWNHGLGEIITALLDAGLQLTMLVEHDTVPYLAIPSQMVPVANGEFGLADRPERLPMSYTMQAIKPSAH